MRSIDPLLLRACVGMAVLATTSAAVADVLIVRAIGPSAARYRPGTTLPDNQVVVLRATDTLTLLDANGSWTLQGPLSVAAKTRVRTASAAPQLTNSNDRRARIGAVRSVEAGDSRPNLWLVDIAQPGATCVVGTVRPTLWRRDTKAAGRTEISGPAGASATLDWAAGQDTHEWPAGMPVTADGSYRLTGVGGAAPVALVLKPLATAPTNPAETGKALIAHGCSAQLDLLIAQSANSGTSGS